MIKCLNIKKLTDLKATVTTGDYGPEPMHNAVQFKADGEMNFFIYNSKSGILVWRPDCQVFLAHSEIIKLVQSVEPKMVPAPQPPSIEAK